MYVGWERRKERHKELSSVAAILFLTNGSHFHILTKCALRPMNCEVQIVIYLMYIYIKTKKQKIKIKK